jgi:hypothetical protein
MSLLMHPPTLVATPYPSPPSPFTRTRTPPIPPPPDSAPEALLHGRISKSADVFAFGITLVSLSVCSLPVLSAA